MFCPKNLSDMYFIWHEVSELPTEGIPVVLKTNMVSYHIGVFNKTWWARVGKRYLEADKVICGSERITGWAYVGGEKAE